jgi:hypothetical protein
MTSGVKDGPASIIAIGPDDTLLDLFDRIRATGQTPVELRIPNDSSLFLTAAEFRTLRDVVDHGRHAVTIHTPDPLRVQLAKLFGLDVALTAAVSPNRPSTPPVKPAAAAATLNSAAPAAQPTKNESDAAAEPPRLAPGLVSPPDEPVSSISEAEAVAQWPEAVVLTPVPPAPRRLLDRLGVGVASGQRSRAAEPEPVVSTDPAVSDEPLTDQPAVEIAGETEAVADAEPSRLPWMGDRRRPSSLVLVGVALFAALVIITAVTFILPSARVRLVLASLPINTELLFDVTADGRPLDERAAFALPAEPVEMSVVVEVSVPTTGVEVVPDGVAAGTVRLANPNPTEVPVEAGTILTTESGVEFSLAEPVVVPAADPDTAGPGEIDIAIQAVNPGTGGNVGTGEIGGRLENGVYYSNRQVATTGGSEREVSVVAQTDIDQLRAAADAESVEQVAAQLPGNGQQAVVAPTLSVLDSTETLDQEVGAEAETISLRAERTVSVLTYDQTEASQRLGDVLSEQLAATVPDGYEFGPIAIGAEDISLVDGTTAGARYRVNSEASAPLALSPDHRTELAGRLAGKSPDEAQQILESLPEVTTFQIERGFGLFTSNLPANAGRIEIDDGP